MGDQFYITVNNEHGKKKFPENSPSRFQVFLDQTMNFDEYKFALVDFMCTTEMFEATMEDVYIYFNVCSEQPICGIKDSLMRYILVHKDQLQMENFVFPYYNSVKPMNTSLLEVYIMDENGKDVSFLAKTTSCTFHFRRRWHTD